MTREKFVENIKARCTDQKQAEKERSVLEKILSYEAAINDRQDELANTRVMSLYHCRHALYNIKDRLPSEWLYEYESFFDMMLAHA